MRSFLAHAVRACLWFLPASVGVDQSHVPSEAGREGGSVEVAPDAMAATGDMSLTAIMAAVPVESRQTGEACGLGAGETAQFGHEDEQGQGGTPPDARTALDESKPTSQIMQAGDGLAQQQQLRLDPPGQPFGLTGNRPLQARRAIGLAARLRAGMVGLELLDQTQMLGQRFKARIGGGIARRIDLGRATGNRRASSRSFLASFKRNRAKARTCRGWNNTTSMPASRRAPATPCSYPPDASSPTVRQARPAYLPGSLAIRNAPTEGGRQCPASSCRYRSRPHACHQAPSSLIPRLRGGRLFLGQEPMTPATMRIR